MDVLCSLSAPLALLPIFSPRALTEPKKEVPLFCAGLISISGCWSPRPARCVVRIARIFSSGFFRAGSGGIRRIGFVGLLRRTVFARGSAVERRGQVWRRRRSLWGFDPLFGCRSGRTSCEPPLQAA